VPYLAVLGHRHVDNQSRDKVYGHKVKRLQANQIKRLVRYALSCPMVQNDV
jgi:hypothetical protein